MTAHDLATVALRTIEDLPQSYEIYGEKDYTSTILRREPQPAALQGSRRRRLEDRPYRGSRLQHGRLRQARRTPGAVVLSGLPSSKARAQESERLIEWAFREYNTVPLFTAGATVDAASVWLGGQPKVPLTVAKDLVVTVPRKSRKNMKVTVAYDQPVAAPIRRASISARSSSPSRICSRSKRHFAATDVDRMGPFGRIATVAGHMIWGSWN